MAGADKIKTDPLATIAGDNGSLVMAPSTGATNRCFQTLQVTTAGTITVCTGFRNGVQIDFRTHQDFLWATVPIGLLIAGKNCAISDITTGTASVIAT